MSELKRHHINEVMDMHNLTRGEMGYSFVYYADDVDRVIAEKDKVITYARALVREDLKIIRHHKYKRCLAMAEMCESEEKRLEAISHIFDTDKECWEYNSDYWARWHKRWLKIVEKFKEGV